MIIEGLLNLIYGFLTAIFSFIELPDLPVEVRSVIDELFDVMLGGINIIGLFLDWNMVKILIPIVIVIVNLDKVWNLIMFIVKKIPFLGIK